ncbi:hypothetical protein QVD17_41449 [Tagetes erecta]|uniref:Uncharacterized protein n=1 Tax=Tagetes erecta TaxID=13708 RepID=A0AAD8JM55_TARER|nr:hypothetical protein QVD17_41449 [Tagetes erecta]
MFFVQPPCSSTSDPGSTDQRPCCLSSTSDPVLVYILVAFNSCSTLLSKLVSYWCSVFLVFVVAAGEVNKEQCTVGMAKKAMVVLSSLAAVEEGKAAIVDEGGVQALVEVIEDGASVKEKEFAVTVTARAKHKIYTTVCLYAAAAVYMLLLCKSVQQNCCMVTVNDECVLRCVSKVQILVAVAPDAT